MRSTGSFLTGVILGAVVGAAATLLMTPTSGHGLREQLMGYVNNVKLEIDQAAKNRRSELEMQLSELRMAPPAKG